MVCGRSNNVNCLNKHLGNCSGEATDHEVRCCSDTFITGWPGPGGWTKNDYITGFDCPWAASEAWTEGCINAMTYSEASAHCASEGGRLCTQAEVEADCTVNTGCSHDDDLIWTSTRVCETSPPTAAPTKNPSKAPSTPVPTATPTPSPTHAPSSSAPSRGPSMGPTLQPTATPTPSPTNAPSSSVPSRGPSMGLTLQPTSSSPTVAPSVASPTEPAADCPGDSGLPADPCPQLPCLYAAIPDGCRCHICPPDAPSSATAPTTEPGPTVSPSSGTNKSNTSGSDSSGSSSSIAVSAIAIALCFFIIIIIAVVMIVKRRRKAGARATAAQQLRGESGLKAEPHDENAAFDHGLDGVKPSMDEVAAAKTAHPDDQLRTFRRKLTASSSDNDLNPSHNCSVQLEMYADVDDDTGPMGHPSAGNISTHDPNLYGAALSEPVATRGGPPVRTELVPNPVFVAPADRMALGVDANSSESDPGLTVARDALGRVLARDTLGRLRVAPDYESVPLFTRPPTVCSDLDYGDEACGAALSGAGTPARPTVPPWGDEEYASVNYSAVNPPFAGGSCGPEQEEYATVDDDIDALPSAPPPLPGTRPPPLPPNNRGGAPPLPAANSGGVGKRKLPSKKEARPAASRKNRAMPMALYASADDALPVSAGGAGMAVYAAPPTAEDGPGHVIYAAGPATPNPAALVSTSDVYAVVNKGPNAARPAPSGNIYSVSDTGESRLRALPSAALPTDGARDSVGSNGVMHGNNIYAVAEATSEVKAPAVAPLGGYAKLNRPPIADANAALEGKDVYAALDIEARTGGTPAAGPSVYTNLIMTEAKAPARTPTPSADLYDNCEANTAAPQSDDSVYATAEVLAETPRLALPATDSVVAYDNSEFSPQLGAGTGLALSQHEPAYATAEVFVVTDSNQL